MPKASAEFIIVFEIISVLLMLALAVFITLIIYRYQQKQNAYFKDIETLKPNFLPLKNLDARGLIVTAKGDTVDFVSRCFYPEAGIEEDPVTGSAHTVMTPYWAAKLDKMTMKAQQLSQRKVCMQF